MTGDWGGLRTRLEKQGVTFSLDYISELLANVRGGLRRGEIFEGFFQPQMDVDLEKLAGWNGASLRLSGAITHGPDFSPHYLGNILLASNIEVPRPVARVFEAWYQQNAPNEVVSVRAGLMLADTEFATSETAFTFMNSTFGWQAWLANDLPFGGPAYPLSTPGARIRVKPVNDAYFQAAIFSGDPTGGDGSNRGGDFPKGTVFSFRGGAFLIGEAGYSPNQGKDAKGLPGNYKVGAWYHTSSRFGDQRFDNTGLSLADPMSSGIPLDHTGNWGFYGVVEQMLYRVPGTADQGLSAFFRIGGAQRSQPDQLLFRRRRRLQRPHPRPAGRQDRASRRVCAHRQPRARVRSRRRIFQRRPLSGTDRGSDGRADLSGQGGAVVDGADRPAIHHSPERRRAQSRRQPRAECMGARTAQHRELLKSWPPSASCLALTNLMSCFRWQTSGAPFGEPLWRSSATASYESTQYGPRQ